MKKQSFIFGSILLLISAALVKIIGAVFKIPLTNLLGGTAMGYFSCAYGIFLPIYAVLGNGLGAAVANLTAKSAACQNFDNVKRIRNVSIIFFGLLGFLISFVIFAFAKPFAQNILASRESTLAVAAIAPCVFFAGISSVIRGHFEGLGNMYPTAVSQVIEALAKLIIGLAGAYIAIEHYAEISQFFNLDATPQALAAACAICGVSVSTLFGAVSLGFFKSDVALPTAKNKLQPDFSYSHIISDVICVMLPIALGALVTNLTSLIDLFTINRILDKCISDNADFFIHNYPFIQNLPEGQAAGFIFGSFSGLAITIFNLVPSVTNMLGKSVLSASSKAYAKGDSKSLEATCKKAISLTSLISAPCALGIAAMSRPILSLLYSSRQNEIEASYTSLAFLGISVIFLCLSSSVFSLLQGTSNAIVPVKIMLAGVALKVVGNIIFLSIPQTAVFGAAVSTLLCYFLIFVLSVIGLRRKCAISLCFGKTVMPFLAGAVLCAISAKASYLLFIGFVSPKAACVLGIGIGAIVYMISLCILQRRCTKLL